MGPMAQDFREAFDLGASETTIAVVDAQGVTMAAVQALYRRVRELERRQDILERENASLRTQAKGRR
jgi:hypothetical protein